MPAASCSLQMDISSKKKLPRGLGILGQGIYKTHGEPQQMHSYEQLLHKNFLGLADNLRDRLRCLQSLLNDIPIDVGKESLDIAFEIGTEVDRVGVLIDIQE